MAVQETLTLSEVVQIHHPLPIWSGTQEAEEGALLRRQCGPPQREFKSLSLRQMGLRKVSTGMKAEAHLSGRGSVTHQVHHCFQQSLSELLNRTGFGMCPRMRLPLHSIWLNSSEEQNAGLSRRRSRVQVPFESPNVLLGQQKRYRDNRY